MHTTEFISAGCITFMAALAYAFTNYWKRGKKTADGLKKPDAKLLPPDQFCRKVLSDKPPRMVIIQIGNGCADSAKGRRYEFRAVEAKSGRGFRTYFDDAVKSSPRQASHPKSENMRKAVSHIRLLMQAAEWHTPDKRKGTLANPAYYLEP